MPTVFVDPSVASSGNGSSEAGAFKYLSEIPQTSNLIVKLRADGLVHRPSASIPTNLTSTNYVRDFGLSTNNVTVETYGTGNPILSGAVAWTGSAVDAVLNGLACKELTSATTISPFWFPRGGRQACYPAMCAPTANDAVDSFMTNPAAFDNIAPGCKGVRFIPAANYGGNTDPTKEVYYYDTDPSAATAYKIQIRAPGFWARANAVEPLIGYNVVLRVASNFTYYLHTIIEYNAEEGYVVIDAGSGSNGVPSGGTTGLFFYSLFAHPYGLRTNRQYAVKDNNTKWIAQLPAGDIDIACYSSCFRVLGDNYTFSDSVVWNVEGFAHGNESVGAGCFIRAEQGVDGVSIGDIIVRQFRTYDRSGSPVQGGGSGNMNNFSIGALYSYECMGTKIQEFASTGTSSGNCVTSGPIYSEEGGGGVRVAGGGSGFTLSDIVIVPRASVHDNAFNIYQEALDVEVSGMVICGAVNPGATQYNKIGNGTASPPANVNRRIKNAWFSGRPKIDLSGYDTNSIFRHDNGNRGGLYDRMVCVNGGSNAVGWDEGKKPSDGLVIQRSIFENLARSSSSQANAFTGMLYQHCVFVKKSGSISEASVTAHIIANGGTVENCVETPNLFSGTLTDEMWQKLTLNDTFTDYEDVSWLAPQLGITLKAYGSARTLVAPKFIHVPFRVGHQAKVMYGTFINQNPLATMSLVAGAGDNDKLYPTLYGGINLIPLVDCPDQSTFTIVLRVTDIGATNGPYQDFVYEIPIQNFASGTLYGPYTLQVMDSLSTTKQLPDFYITVGE